MIFEKSHKKAFKIKKNIVAKNHSKKHLKLKKI
jgi:hypothetical protein